MQELLGDIPGVIVYFDDILIFGKDINEHNKNLKNVLEKINLSGMTLNKQKSTFCVNKIKFLGHEISDQGISPDKSKTTAINSISPPT